MPMSNSAELTGRVGAESTDHLRASRSGATGCLLPGVSVRRRRWRRPSSPEPSPHRISRPGSPRRIRRSRHDERHPTTLSFIFCQDSSRSARTLIEVTWRPLSTTSSAPSRTFTRLAFPISASTDSRLASEGNSRACPLRPATRRACPRRQNAATQRRNDATAQRRGERSRRRGKRGDLKAGLTPTLLVVLSRGVFHVSLPITQPYADVPAHEDSFPARRLVESRKVIGGHQTHRHRVLDQP